MIADEFDPYYETLDGYYDVPAQPVPPPPGKANSDTWVTVDHDGWLIVGKRKTNFQILERRKQYAFVRHVVNGASQGCRWVDESTLLDGDPATVFYDADPRWVPEEP
jgi:hypothetical protein